MFGYFVAGMFVGGFVILIVMCSIMTNKPDNN